MPTSYVTPAPPVLTRASRRRSPAVVRGASGGERLPYVLLGLIVLGGALLRLRYLHEPMRWDESATFQEYARGSLGTIVSTYNRPNNQILYTLLEHLGIKTFGTGIAAVRLVAFAAGIAIIPASFLAARRLYDQTAGLFAAALTATLGPLVDYSVNGRGYTLGALFVVLLPKRAHNLRCGCAQHQHNPEAGEAPSTASRDSLSAAPDDVARRKPAARGVTCSARFASNVLLCATASGLARYTSLSLPMQSNSGARRGKTAPWWHVDYGRGGSVRWS